jgi:hypothetical protein
MFMTVYRGLGLLLISCFIFILSCEKIEDAPQETSSESHQESKSSLDDDKYFDLDRKADIKEDINKTMEIIESDLDSIHRTIEENESDL